MTAAATPLGEPRVTQESAAPAPTDQAPAKWTGRSVSVQMDPSAHLVTLATALVFALIGTLCFAVLSAPILGTIALGLAVLTIPLRNMQLNKKITVVEDTMKDIFKKESKSKTDDFSDLPEVKISKESDSVYVLEKPPGVNSYFHGKVDGKLIYLGKWNTKEIGIYVFDKDYKSATWKIALENETIQLTPNKIIANDPEDKNGKLKFQD